MSTTAAAQPEAREHARAPSELPGPGGPLLRLALATAGLLALELAVIRWMSSQIRIFAYFNNLVLIGAFLGMGLGVAVGRRRPHAFHGLFPALLAFTLVVGTAEWTGLAHLSFPDLSIHLWGAEVARRLGIFALNMGIVLALFWGVVGVFFLAGTAVGHFFARSETLRSYSFDLLGSLLGVLGFAVLTGVGSGPGVWFAGALVLLVPLSGRRLSLACAAAVVAVAGLSGLGARYSPYNRIELVPLPDGDVMVEVNRDFHQYVHDLSEARLAAEEEDSTRARLTHYRDAYDVPYVLADGRQRALLIGAGTGNDAQAALRAGFGEVVSVDIDGHILDLGREIHPEAPYHDPRVTQVVNDGRAFLEQYQGSPFDLVSFGLVDSHAMFSSMSSLRLENYLYSREGLRAGWEHVAEGGLLAVTFSVFAGPWISDRMYWTVAAATERVPVMVHHGMNVSRTYVVAKEPATLDLARVRPFPTLVSGEDPETVHITTDNWPFLYLRPGEVPWGYIVLLVGVVATAALGVVPVFGASTLRTGFDAPLFLMGAAFLLLETRGVTVLSLLFGTTWTVNVAVFAGILATALVANMWVSARRPTRALPWAVPLFLSLALLWAVPTGALNQMALPTRGVVGALLVGLPVGFAGVIVSILLARSPNPTASLGSNLLGAVLGGCLEYLSMWTGLRGLVLLAALLYLAAGYAALRRRGLAASPAPA